MDQTKAIIIDLDGTIANNFHRIKHFSNGKLDWKTLLDPALIVHDTLMTESIPELLTRMKPLLRIILLSGRVSEQYKATEKWLKIKKITFHKLVMRSPGEKYSKDTVFKARKVKSFLKKFDVVLALDDQPDILEVYKNLGILVLQITKPADWDRIDLILKDLLIKTE